MNMRKMLVTGGAGFIGSNFIHHVIDSEPSIEIVNLDLLTYAGNLGNLQSLDPKRYTFVKGNICSEALVSEIITGHDIDTIVHFAAESHVDRSIHSPANFIQTNVVGTFSLLEAVRKHESRTKDRGSIRFHHISTDEVFGSLDPDALPFSETTPYNPRSPYAASKAASDHLVRAYSQTYGLDVTLSNCSNNYGPFQFPEKLVPLVLLNAIEGRPLPIYGDGQQIRDWLYVGDHCDAILAVLKNGQSSETYLIGGHNQPTNLELVTLICSLLDRLVPQSPYAPHSQLIEFVADRPGHDRRYEINTRHIENTLGWVPKHDLRTGLEKTIAWYLDHRDWLDSTRNRPSFASWIEEHYQSRPEST